MNIVHISPVFSPYFSGMTNVVVNQTRELVKRGHHVTVLAPRYNSDWKKEEMVDGVLVKRVTPLLKYGNGGFVPGLFAELRRISKSTPIDAVHIHTPFFGGVEVIWMARILGVLKGVTVALQYHHDPQLNAFTTMLSFPSRIVFSSLVKRVDVVIVSSLDYAKESEIRSLVDDRFIEIPFGVNAERFKMTDLRNKKEEESVKLLFVGALDKAHHFKGVDVLLEAFQKVVLNHKSYVSAEALAKEGILHLDIVGGGDMLSYYRKKVEEMDMSKHVVFHGRVSDDALPKFHEEADVFVFPSTGKAEAFGLVALEAMSAGLPVIASNLPGVRSLFESQELLVTPGDSEDLAKKMSRVLNDAQMRRTIGEENRKRVLEKYTWEKATDALEAMYKSHKR